MPDTPLDALAAELGSTAARIERELRLVVAAALSEIREEMAALRAARAEAELRALAAERERDAAVSQRLAALGDGTAARLERQRDHDVLIAESRQAGAELRAELTLWRQDLETVIRDRLSTVRDGEPGPPGESITGPPGPPGPPGILPLVTAWARGVHYAGAVVTHADSTWQAVRDTGEEPPGPDWHCLAAAGQSGDDGRSFTVRGTWTAAETYRALDVVVTGGSSFVARLDDPGPCPGAGWHMLASEGRRGKQGQTGERGPPGPAISRLSVDDEGLLTLASSDGSTVAADLYPLLSR